MKTFQEFLDEALVASLVKAAARSLLKKKAVTQKVASASVKPSVSKTIKLPSKVTGFQTGRGSKYTYTQKPQSWPQTQRTAAKDPYHPTAPGVKQKSDYTMFTTPDASMTMRQRFVSGSKEPFYKGLPQSTTPRRGRAPVEVWNRYAEKGNRGAIHPGSPITDIQTTTRGSNVGLYGAQRKELRDRVKTGLQRPANIQALKKELGIKSMNSSNSSTTYRNLGAGRKESVKEQRDFFDFITEARRRMKVLRTAHYTSASNKAEILRSGFKDSPSTGTYHPDDRKGIVYTTPSSRVGGDYGYSRVNLRLVNPKMKSTDSPRDFGKNIKRWMSSASDEDINDKKGKPTSAVDQARSAFKKGDKVVRVPNAHGGFTPRPGQAQGSYVMMDKEVANKSIDRTPSRTMKAKGKKRRSQTQPKKKLQTESKARQDNESSRYEDDTYRTTQQKLNDPRLRKLRRFFNREVGRYTV